MTHLLLPLFGVAKPVIAMAHFPPLPGLPRCEAGVPRVLDRVASDLATLIDGGADGIFCSTGVPA